MIFYQIIVLLVESFYCLAKERSLPDIIVDILKEFQRIQTLEASHQGSSSPISSLWKVIRYLLALLSNFEASRKFIRLEKVHFQKKIAQNTFRSQHPTMMSDYEIYVSKYLQYSNNSISEQNDELTMPKYLYKPNAPVREPKQELNNKKCIPNLTLQPRRKHNYSIMK